ncbi:MAG: ribonuclease, partial [Pseudonocardiales bacterium]|nr:ribonuclease [Pseudonocardiales bacterium]
SRDAADNHHVLAELHAHDRARGRFVAAADEAGRGCLAGPLVGAAVLFDLDRRDLLELLDGVNDSKKLTANKRRALVPRILVAAERVALRTVDSEEIDRNGIQEGNLRVLEEALRAVAAAPCERMLVDYYKLPNMHVESITRGDAVSLTTAAASVLATEIHAQLMQVLDQQHPSYGFAQHGGYYSEAHLTAVREHGPCPAHRRSNRRIAELLV